MDLFADDLTDDLIHPLFNQVIGTEGDDSLKGTSDTDYFYGMGGDDTLVGGGGYDQLVGGTGDDLMLGGKGDDTLADEDNGSDQLFGEEGDDNLGVTRDAASPDTPEHVSLNGGVGDDWLTVNATTGDGSAYAMSATLSGGDGADTFYIGSVQHATVDGGAGDDTVRASVGQDVVISLGDGADVIELQNQVEGGPLVVTDFAAGDGGDAIKLRDFLGGIIPGWQQDNPFGDGHLRLHQDGADTVLQLDADGGGDSWTDLIVFQHTQAADFTAANLDDFPPDGSPFPGQSIDGTAGDDQLSGTNGGDTINGLGGADWIDAGAGDDVLHGGDGNDTVSGGLGHNTVYGDAGDDAVSAGPNGEAYGGDGADQLDVSYFDAYTGAVTLSGGAGDDTISAASGPDIASSILAQGDDGNDTFFLYGDGTAVVDGGAGEDQFNLQQLGAHTTLTLGEGADVVRVDPDLGQDMRVVITDFAAGAGGDRLDLTDFLANDLQGWDFTTNPFADGYLRLAAEDGGTALQYSAAADGDWSDLFFLQGVTPGELTADNLSGYPGDGSVPPGVSIVGTRADDSLDGGLGPDTILGGKGNDLLDGGAGDDSLLGAAGDDTLVGGYGSDFLNGGGGADVLQEYSGHGVDTFIGGGGDDIIGFYRDFETPDPSHVLIKAGSGDDQVTVNAGGVDGPSLNLIAGAGDDVLNVNYVAAATISGGAGADVITLGYSTYLVDAGTGDDLVELHSGGVDIDITLGAGADRVSLDEYYIFDYGVAQVRDFTAADALDLAEFVNTQLFGVGDDPFGAGYLRLAQEGKDTVLQIDRGGWSDLLRLDHVDALDLGTRQLGGYQPGDVWLVGGDGQDKLVASTGLTHLDGGGGADVLVGSKGADVLVGGGGADTLTGKGGADIFMFTQVADSTPVAHDTIIDLTDSDTIDLSQVDANSLVGGDQTFVVVKHLDGHTNELTIAYRSGADVTVIEGDVDGDGAADFQLVIQGDHHDFANLVL